MPEVWVCSGCYAICYEVPHEEGQKPVCGDCGAPLGPEQSLGIEEAKP